MVSEFDNHNQSLRLFEQNSWEGNPLVLGYEIKLSASNKKGYSNCALCINLTGKYPLEFKWSGWHDGCICFQIPILMDDDLMARYQKLVARGEDTPEAVFELQKGARIVDFPLNYLNHIQNKKNQISIS